MIKFTEIANKLNYPANVKSKLSTLHTGIINYVINNFTGKVSQRRHIIDIMNTVSYKVIVGDTIPNVWNVNDPLKNMSVVEDVYCKSKIGDLYLVERDVTWDVDIVDDSTVVEDSSVTPKPITTKKFSNGKSHIVNQRVSDKSDLYLSPPTVSKFDSKKVWKSGTIGNTEYCIYYSLPIIPTKQCEISVTTDINLMVEADFLSLFPTQFISTRASSMYVEVPNMDFDKKLGVILPMQGFSRSDVVDNIIKYPHLFRLYRKVDGKNVNFYSYIELKGELHRITDIWNELPDAVNIPYHPDFIKEYVIRRYLLERDIGNIKHKYPIYGDLSPYLTLFMTQSEYMSYGYDNMLDLATACVKSRILYKQSRNPILTKLKEIGNA